MIRRMRTLGFAMLMPFVLPLTACAPKQNHYVIASTSTIIGVEVGSNAATTPQAKLGYNRSELALVPTNRGRCADKEGAACEVPSGSQGAADVADVVMELRYGGIFDMGPSSGIYQRLAVGKNAVSGSGAAVMFSKDAKGEVEPGVAAAAALSAKSLHQAMDAEAVARAALSERLATPAGAMKAEKIQAFAKDCIKLPADESKKLSQRFAGKPRADFETWLRDQYALRAERWLNTCQF